MNLPPFNWDEIREDLLIGSCPTAPRDIDRVRDELRADAVLSLQHDECRANLAIDHEALQARARARRLTMVNEPMRDFDAADHRRVLPRAIHRLRALLVEHQRVFVHCTAGVTRAPLVVLGYFVFVEMMPPEAAIDLIRGARHVAAPTWSALNGCQLALVDGNRMEIERRALSLRARNPEFDTIRSWRQAEREVLRAVFTGHGGLGRE